MINFGTDCYYASGVGINNSGQIAGACDGSGGDHAFLYSAGTVTDLGPYLEPLGETQSTAVAISDSGQVTGTYDAGGADPGHAFLYSAGNVIEIGTVRPGEDYLGSSGNGINNLGQIVGEAGFYEDFTYVSHAFLYAGGTMTDLKTFGGMSWAYSINDSGQVTGTSVLANNTTEHAFLYSGNMIDLPTFGGSITEGYSINNSGQVTGYSALTGDTASHAFVYSGETMLDLNSLGSGWTASWGSSINNYGQIIGAFKDSTGTRSLFLYSGGKMVNLGQLIPTDSGFELESANSINDAGQITGTNNNAGYLATPFYRQVDRNTPDVPQYFGYVKASTGQKSKTANTGCALTSAANMARSLIALSSRQTGNHNPTITPAQLDILLTAPFVNGYRSNNDLNWRQFSTALHSYARIQTTLKLLPGISYSDLDEMLTSEIYTYGHRVILRFKERKTNSSDPSIPPDDKGTHFVWVIGKDDRGDWEIADPGWNYVADDYSTVLSSLQTHLSVSGFDTVAGSNTDFAQQGDYINRTFTPDAIISAINLDYVPPSSQNSAVNTHRNVRRATAAHKHGSNLAAAPVSSTDTSGTTAGISVSATGPVDFVVTDPQGLRLGHDVQSGTDFAEIPNGSYYVESPICSTDDDVGGDDAGSNEKIAEYALSGTGWLLARANWQCFRYIGNQHRHGRARRRSEKYHANN